MLRYRVLMRNAAHSVFLFARPTLRAWSVWMDSSHAPLPRTYAERSALGLPFCPPDPAGLVGLDGLEPSTSRLSGARSNHLSYKPI